MVDHLANRVREAGRTYLYTFATCLPADLEACTGAFGFARAIGAEIDQMAVRRVLGLPMDEARLRALEAEAARHSTGYVVDTFRGADSAHWDSFVELRNRLIVEQPQGSMTAEPMRTTPEALRELVEADEANGDLTWTTVATRDERVVAFTATTLPATKDAAAVLGTLVEPDHRGHRLGTAVKAANLRRLVSERPDVTRLVTENAEVNHEMVRINERFGFEVVALVPVIVLRV
jgi:RimJ/RimL family protein N-acetyltransferase